MGPHSVSPTIKPTIIPKELFSAEDKKVSNGIGKTLHSEG